MAFEGKAINFLTSLSGINLFSTTMCTTCERMASFRPLAFELEAKEICPHPTSLLPPLGSAIKNLGLFSKSPGDFKMETMDF